jgi:hypothetical protein
VVSSTAGTNGAETDRHFAGHQMGGVRHVACGLLMPRRRIGEILVLADPVHEQRELGRRQPKDMAYAVLLEDLDQHADDGAAHDIAHAEAPFGVVSWGVFFVWRGSSIARVG